MIVNDTMTVLEQVDMVLSHHYHQDGYGYGDYGSYGDGDGYALYGGDG